jgi:hypothetical protein
VAESPRAVLDANLIVRGLLTPYGGAGRLLGELARGHFVFVTSESILYEVATILSEPRVQRYGPFPRDEIRRRTDLLRRIGVLVPGRFDVSLVPPTPRTTRSWPAPWKETRTTSSRTIVATCCRSR